MEVAEEPEKVPDNSRLSSSSGVPMKSDSSMKNRQEFTKETTERYIMSVPALQLWLQYGSIVEIVVLSNTLIQSNILTAVEQIALKTAADTNSPLRLKIILTCLSLQLR